jgi:hypothetical protein
VGYSVIDFFYEMVMKFITYLFKIEIAGFSSISLTCIFFYHCCPAVNHRGTAVQAGVLLQVAHSVSSLIKYKNQDVENMQLKW